MVLYTKFNLLHIRNNIMLVLLICNFATPYLTAIVLRMHTII